MGEEETMVREYFVAKPGDKWRVIVDGRQLGQYPSDEAARMAAITSAKADTSAGVPARVLCEERRGRLSAVYDSGADGSQAGRRSA